MEKYPKGVRVNRDPVNESKNKVCGIICMGGQRRKMSKWFSDEVFVLVVNKRRAFEEWLQKRDRDSF